MRDEKKDILNINTQKNVIQPLHDIDMSAHVDNTPMESVSLNISCQGACGYRHNNSAFRNRITLDVNEFGLIQNEVGVDDQHRCDSMGTINRSYTTDIIDDPLPLLTDLSRRVNYTYPMDDTQINGNQDEKNKNSSKGCIGRSTSLPDLSKRILPLKKNCSYDCRSVALSSLSYEDVHTGSTIRRDSSQFTSAHHEGINSHSSNVILDIDRRWHSSPFTPGDTPSRGRRNLQTTMVKIINSRGTSSPPNYRSLIFSILKDEPPKYQDVTGKKLADKLVSNMF